MPEIPLSEIVDHCDELLRISEVRDYDRAGNGLQVQNNGKVVRIAATVDATLATVRKAARLKADLLLVHHGLFWGPSHPWTGKRYELIRTLFASNMAVYSAHLPLDLHPRLGNNALLCRALQFQKLKPFFLDREQFLGFRSNVRLHRNELAKRLEKAVGGPVRLLPGGPEVCRQVGVVSGGAGEQAGKAAAEGVDTFITGEGPHWTYALAEDLGINILYGGHYATETLGVKALAEYLAKKFKVPWVFVDHPTGL